MLERTSESKLLRTHLQLLHSFPDILRVLHPIRVSDIVHLQPKKLLLRRAESMREPYLLMYPVLFAERIHYRMHELLVVDTSVPLAQVAHRRAH